MRHRREFPELMTRLGIKSAAEIGVAEGDFSRVLLGCTSLERLFLIDPWTREPELAKVRRLAVEDSRVTMIRDRSPDVASNFGRRSIDMVYIDTQHEYDATVAHLAAWLPKTRVLLAGHDYVQWNAAARCECGVPLAVEEMAERHGLRVHVIGQDGPSMLDRMRVAHHASSRRPGRYGDNYPSWWVYV